MSIVRLYNCPYFINGECSLRSHDDPLIDFWNTKCIAEGVIPHCPKGRVYCHVDADTDKWSKGTLELIRILVKGWRRNGNGNTGEIIDIIEQILRRRDDMKDSSSEALCVSRKWFEEKQEEARQEGREEAWDLARRVVDSADDCYEYSEINKVFNVNNISSVFNMPPLTALKIDMRYQEGEKRALHIGDEVEFGVLRGYVIEILSSDEVRVLTKIYGTFTVLYKNCEKTGRHSDEIEKVMTSFEKGDSE